MTISSISGHKAAPGSQYGAAKAAEIFLSGALALELAPLRIRANTVCPGSILFPGGGWASYQERDPEGFHRFETEEFPLGRLGTVEVAVPGSAMPFARQREQGIPLPAVHLPSDYHLFVVVAIAYIRQPIAAERYPEYG